MKKQNLMLVVATALSVVAFPSLAAGEGVAAIGAINTEVGELSASAWPVVISVVTTFVSLKLFKRFTGKI